MTTSKKLGFLLLPLIPLSAIGVVEIVNGLIPPKPPEVSEIGCRPALEATHQFAKPPMPAPQPQPPQPPPSK